MAPAKKTVFRDEWLSMENYHAWLKKVDKDPHSASCKLCNKKFSLSNIGQRALRSHIKSAKHQKVLSSEIGTPKLIEILRNCDQNGNEATKSCVTLQSSGNFIFHSTLFTFK